MSLRRSSRAKTAQSEMKRQRIAQALGSDNDSDENFSLDQVLTELRAANAKKMVKAAKKKKPSTSSDDFLNQLAFKRHWHSETGCPCLLAPALNQRRPRGAPKAPRKTPKKRAPRKPKTPAKATQSKAEPSTSSLNVDLCSDDENKPTSANIPDKQVDNIKTKLNSFFKNFESSDEEEIELKLKPKTENDNQPKRGKEFYELESDSEDVVAEEKPGINITSSGNTNDVINVLEKDSSFSLADKTLENKPKSEDLMAIVDEIIKDDDIVDVSAIEQKQSNAQLLEEYKKKTEEMLGSVSSLIDEFSKTNENKKEEMPPEPKSCPICLEDIGVENPAMTTFCGHLFCAECITHVAKTSKKCPTCRKAVGLKKIHPVYL